MTGAEITVTFLGTGSAIPSNDRQQSCAVLRHQEGLFMFDCGEGSQYALRKLGISTRKELVIWISHLHSDHFLGLPGLLSSFELLGRDDPITVIGPVGTKITVENLVKANYVNFSYQLGVVELEPGQIFESKNYIIQAIKAKHDGRALSVIWREKDFPGKVDMAKLEELGLGPGPHISQLQEGKIVQVEGIELRPEDIIGPPRKGRSVVYTGDTSYNTELVDHIKNVNLLIHEGTYPSDMKELARERQHCTIDQTASIAKLSEPDQLVITHLSPRIHHLQKEEQKAKSIFANTTIAYQGLTIEIPYPYHEID